MFMFFNIHFSHQMASLYYWSNKLPMEIMYTEHHIVCPFSAYPLGVCILLPTHFGKDTIAP